VEIEKRLKLRFNPQQVYAHLAITPEDSAATINADGLVEDLSYGGIRIRLQQPLDLVFDQAQVYISITLPKSGIPLSIQGTIRHIADENRTFGLQFSGNPLENDLDDFMFECVKHAA
jgi:PilZ domain